MTEYEKLERLMREIGTGVNVIKHQVAEHDKALQRLGGQPIKNSLPSFGRPSRKVEDNPKSRLLGEIIQNVYRASQDPSAVGWLNDNGVFLAKAMGEDTPSAGGYLVPPEYLPEILWIPERGVVEPRLRVVQMGAKKKDIPRRTSTVTTDWIHEGETITPSEPALDQVELTALDQAGLTPVYNNLLTDASPDVQQFLTEIFSEAMLLEADAQIMTGTGDPCSGVLTAAAGYSVVMGSGSAAFSMIGFETISEAISKISPTVLAAACFVMHPDILHFIRILKDANGQPIWSPAGSGPGQLYGYDIVESTKAPGKGDSAPSTPFIAFGNFNGFVKGDRQQLTIAVNPYSQFEKLQTLIRWNRRIALYLAQPAMFCRIMTHS